MDDANSTTPKERFMAFMTADLEGDEKEATRLVQEMVDAGDIPQQFADDYLKRRRKAQERPQS